MFIWGARLGRPRRVTYFDIDSTESFRMHASHRLTLIAAGMVALFCVPNQVAGQAADTLPSPVTGSIDLGLVAASGNTDLTTFNLGQELKYAHGKWTVKQGAKMVYGQTGGVESANEYAVYVRPDYQLSARWKGYFLGSWDRNTFIGISQRFQEGVGVSYAAVQGPKHSLTLDAGVAFYQQEFTSGLSSSFPAARGQGTYKFAFTPKAYIQNTFVYIPNLENSDDYRINNELALVAPIAGRLALKAAYLLQYQNAPQPGFGTTDNLYTTGIQYTF
jgi:putative salt-induced outer membrane protein YdiY